MFIVHSLGHNLCTVEEGQIGAENFTKTHKENEAANQE